MSRSPVLPSKQRVVKVPIKECQMSSLGTSARSACHTSTSLPPPLKRFHQTTGDTEISFQDNK